MWVGHLRLGFSSPAYTLLVVLRRLDLVGAQCDTISLKLLRIGALIQVTARKAWVSWSQSCPYRAPFRSRAPRPHAAHAFPMTFLKPVVSFSGADTPFLVPRGRSLKAGPAQKGGFFSR
jgi:hypothetical protein